MISGSHELQLFHSAPILQPDVFECSFSPSCPDTTLAVPPCSGNAPPYVFGCCLGSSHLQGGFPKGVEKGAGVKFKHCCSVSCCFPTRIVAVSCTVLSGAGTPALSNSLSPCVCQVLICKTGIGAHERNQPGLSQGNGTRTEGAKGF